MIQSSNYGSIHVTRKGIFYQRLQNILFLLVIKVLGREQWSRTFSANRIVFKVIVPEHLIWSMPIPRCDSRHVVAISCNLIGHFFTRIGSYWETDRPVTASDAWTVQNEPRFDHFRSKENREQASPNSLFLHRDEEDGNLERKTTTQISYPAVLAGLLKSASCAGIGAMHTIHAQLLCTKP